MNTEQLLQIVSIGVQSNVPFVLESEPGLAKTALIGGIARSLGWKFKSMIGSIHDPTDYSGLPFSSNGVVRYMPFDWVHQFSEETVGEEPGLLFFDEINMAQQSTLAAQMKVIHEGVVGDVRLGPNVARIAAMNPPEIANVPDLLPALANRFAHLKWHMDAEYWVNATLAGYPDPKVTPLPTEWRNNLPQTRALVASFVSKNLDAYHARPKDESQWGKAWPSPRTWDMTATLLAASKSIGAGESIQISLVESCVGAGQAIAFIQYMRELDLTDPKELLDMAINGKIKSFKFPKKGDQMYVLLNSVVSYFLNHNTEQLWHAAWDVMAAATQDATKMDTAAAAGKALAKGRKPGYGTPTGAKSLYQVLALADIAKVPAKAKVA